MKKEELNNLDNAFREKLEGHQVAPPPHIWSGVQDKLAALKRKKRIALISWISAAAVVVLAFLAGWYVNEKSGLQVTEMAQKEMVQQENSVSDNNNKAKTEAHEQVKTDSAEEEILAEPSENKTSPMPERILLAEGKSPEEKTKVWQEEKESEANVERTTPARLEKISGRISENETISAGAIEEEEINRQDLTEYEKVLIAENTQTFAKVNKENKGWKLGIGLSPGYSSQTSNHSEIYAQNMTYNSSEGNKNLGAGISVQYKTGKRWSVESGVYYAKNGQKSGNSPSLFALTDNSQGDLADAPFATERMYFNTAVKMADNQMAMNSSAGVIEFKGVPEGTVLAANPEEYNGFSNSLLTNGEFSQVFDFVEIPLYLRYLVVDAKIDLELVGGLNAGLVVGNNAFMRNEYGLQNVGKTRDVAPVNLSGTVGFGVNYGLGKHISLAVEPRVNYFLNSLNTSSDVEYRPYRIGVYTGLYYDF